MDEFSVKEIIEAVKTMTPLKASGMDGFHALFYKKKYWHVMGEDVSQYCIDALNRRRDMVEINRTNIVLIPKVNTPYNMS